MVDRDITGQIRRSSLNRLPALLGIDEDSLRELADRVRQFDSNQSNETRSRKALESLAKLFGQSNLVESVSEKNMKDWLRKKEVKALTLMAVAQAYSHEELHETEVFNELLTDLGIKPEPTRVEGE